jgi:hypothetical protein
LSYDPLDIQKIDALYIDEYDVSFVLAYDEKTCRSDDILINTERFFDKDAFRIERTSARQAVKCASLMVDVACNTMKKISALHESLEAIYISTMDFKAKEEYTRKLMSEILG